MVSFEVEYVLSLGSRKLDSTSREVLRNVLDFSPNKVFFTTTTKAGLRVNCSIETRLSNYPPSKSTELPLDLHDHDHHLHPGSLLLVTPSRALLFYQILAGSQALRAQNVLVLPTSSEHTIHRDVDCKVLREYSVIDRYVLLLIASQLVLGMITIGPSLIVIFYDMLLYVFRTATYDIPVIGGAARNRPRPRAPSLSERPSGMPRRLTLPSAASIQEDVKARLSGSSHEKRDGSAIIGDE